MSLLAKLKQRKLVQWLLAYSAGAWLLLQVIGLVSASFNWSPTVMRASTIAAGVGLLVALLLAWFHGERGAQKVSGSELLLLALLLAIGGGLLWKFAPTEPESSPKVASTSSLGNSAPDKSIAVLPFVNMSGDPANEYFSDGISDEILNVLAGAPGLQVAARTSSFSFKGKAMEVPAIARELQVRMVLEGSVRKQGDKVRITAQLIDARTGFHAWSQTYDRKLEDIFAIQDEIAKSISDELSVKLGNVGTPRHASGGTRNLQAYDLYLQGMSLWHTRNEKALWEAVSVFEKAAAVDPKFAQAYAGLALVYAVMGEYSSRITYAEAIERSDNFAKLALALDPTLPEIYAAMGSNAATHRQWQTSDALLSRAIELRPSFATAYQWQGFNRMFAGDLEAGRAAFDRAGRLDPRSAAIGDNHALALLFLGRYDEAIARCQRVFEYAPDYPYCLDDSSLASLLAGDYASAQAMLDRLAAQINPSALGEGKKLVDALQGRADRRAFAVWLASLPRYSRTDPASHNVINAVSTPSVLVMLGYHDLALDFMERTSSDVGNDTNLAILPPVMDAIRCQDRFRAVVDRIKATDPYAAKVCAPKQ
jgi:adenylate cyclase